MRRAAPTLGLLIGAAALFVAIAGCGKSGSGDGAKQAPAVAPTGTELTTPPETVVPPDVPQAANPEEAEPPPGPTAGAPAAESGTPQLVNLLVDELAGLTFEGKATKAIGWRDVRGENTVVFSEKRGTGAAGANASLYVTHFAKGADAKVVTMRKIKELVPDCEFDLTARFDHRALEVTDLDGNGIGEVTFAYSFACRSDVSPESLKLFMLENGQKYVIRGNRQLQFPDGELVGGERTMNERLAKAAPSFTAHAVKVWERIVEEKM